MAESPGEEDVITLIQCQHLSSLSFIKGIIYNGLCLSVCSRESDLTMCCTSYLHEQIHESDRIKAVPNPSRISLFFPCSLSLTHPVVGWKLDDFKCEFISRAVVAGVLVDSLERNASTGQWQWRSRSPLWLQPRWQDVCDNHSCMLSDEARQFRSNHPVVMMFLLLPDVS